MAGTARRIARDVAFVGRARELEIADGLLDDTARGNGHILLLAGEAGIGKTRLLSEIARRARRRRMLVLRGRCEENAGSSYGAFYDALDGYVAEASEATLRRKLGDHAGVLAQLLPRVRARLGEVAEPIALQPNEERTRLLDAVSQFLIAVGAETSLLLVIDDLHWGDDDTLALFRHVGRMLASHPILLLGAYRGEEVQAEGSLASTVAVLRRHPFCERVALSGLAEAEVTLLLQTLAEQRSSAWSPGPVSSDLTTAISTDTKGNPFFVRSLVLHLEEQGRLQIEEGCWRAPMPLDELALPADIQELLWQRIARLSLEARTLLTAAAVVGPTFRFDLATAVSELGEDHALAALDEALAAQLIEPAPILESYAFVHAVVRQCLYDNIEATQKSRLHRSAAVAMVTALQEHTPEQDGRIAWHFHRSVSLPGAERGAIYALGVAEGAERASAFAEAASYVQTALDLLRADDARRPRLLCRLGRNLVLAQKEDQALGVIQEAGVLVAQTESPASAAEYLAGLLDPLFTAGCFSTAFAVARLGLRWAGGNHDTTWASLHAIAEIEQDFAAAEHPGIMVETELRQEIGRVFAPLIPAVPGYAYLFIRRDQSHDVVDLGRDVYLKGQYRRALPALREYATNARNASFGSPMDPMSTWATIARCHIALGDLAPARSVLESSAALARRFPGSVSTPLFFAAVTTFEQSATTDGRPYPTRPPREKRHSIAPPPTPRSLAGGRDAAGCRARWSSYPRCSRRSSRPPDTPTATS